MNPQPPDGWSWSLSPYEVAYVERFRVRPVREGATESQTIKDSLDAEAAGILDLERARVRRPGWGSRTARLPGLWLSLIAVGAVLATVLTLAVVHNVASANDYSTRKVSVDVVGVSN
jgi:hypothetical protein